MTHVMSCYRNQIAPQRDATDRHRSCQAQTEGIECDGHVDNLEPSHAAGGNGQGTATTEDGAPVPEKAPRTPAPCPGHSAPGCVEEKPKRHAYEDPRPDRQSQQLGLRREQPERPSQHRVAASRDAPPRWVLKH